MLTRSDREEALQEGETLDELRMAGLKILQRRDGYRFSLDPLLLSSFGRVGEGERVVDLGTGAGVIPLLLARRSEARYILGIENQHSLADRARRNVRLNALEKRVQIVEGDLRELAAPLSREPFDAVFSNPPFRRSGSGRVASVAERAAARHELAGGLADFLGAGAVLLREGGRIYLVYLAERLAELLALLREEGLEPKRIRCVHSRPNECARMVLVEGRKGGRTGLQVESPLIVYEGEGYSKEILRIYGEEVEG